MRIFIPKSVLILIVFIITLSGFKYGNDLFEFSKHLEIFSHVYKTVQEEYVEEVPASEMAQIAIKNMPVYKGLEVLDRNERCALVMDVTGSMTDHVASMKRWIKMNQNP